jgi:hypothetical protein
MERALRLLDTLDSLVWALRVALAGRWGDWLRAVCLGVAACLAAAAGAPRLI